MSVGVGSEQETPGSFTRSCCRGKLTATTAFGPGIRSKTAPVGSLICGRRGCMLKIPNLLSRTRVPMIGISVPMIGLRLLTIGIRLLITLTGISVPIIEQG